MPIFEFKCPKCNKIFETSQRWNDPAPVCEQDQVQMEKIFSQIARPAFKGTGFYETDYKGKK